jgi:hypothetical protein
MLNPNAPPKTSMQDITDKQKISVAYKSEKSAMRPLGVVVVVVLFFVFSVVGAALMMLEGDSWWIVNLAITALLAYWFRKLWWGDDQERKIAVFLGFFIAALSWFGSPDSSVENWSAMELAVLAEGCYFLLAASYLIYMRKSPFFANQLAR